MPERGRIEPGRAKGVRGSLAKERLLSRKSGPRIRLEYLPLRPERTERPVAEWVAWEARGQRERVGCEAHEVKGSEGSTGQRGGEGLPWGSGGTARERAERTGEDGGAFSEGASLAFPSQGE